MQIFFCIFQARIEVIKQEKEKIAESMLRTQFKMEMLVYAQDRTYNNSWSDHKADDESKSKKTPKVLSIYSTRDNHATLQELMLHLKSYYKVSLFFQRDTS